jgi:hypothetical protein
MNDDCDPRRTLDAALADLYEKFDSIPESSIETRARLERMITVLEGEIMDRVTRLLAPYS